MSDFNLPHSSSRIHIAVFGKRNSGKSSLINALTGQEISLVSPTAGTTTDPVSKAVELSPLGACVLIDTAGFDDCGDLGLQRVEKTRKILDKTDIAIILCRDAAASFELEWASELKKRHIPYLAVISQADRQHGIFALEEQVRGALKCDTVCTSAKDGTGIPELISALARLIPEDFDSQSITRSLAGKGDTVLLIMPQDEQAPKGRLILPQVQTIRELLDKDCTVICSTLSGMDASLSALAKPPKLIITDSQVFSSVYEKKPKESLLTSFSVLFAAYKGDISEFINGAEAIPKLKAGDKVLIAEACAHNAKDGDIARVKIPALLKKKVCDGIEIHVVSGAEFNADLKDYSLIIHCGACMFNRRLVLSRIAAAQAAGVPITNYGIAIAKLNDILDKITY